MKWLNSWLRENFGYSKKEINGSLVLVLIIFLVSLTTYAYDYYQYANNAVSVGEDSKILDKWSEELSWQQDEPPSQTKEATEIQHWILTKFDPNKVSKDELIGMGIPAKLASTWSNYTSKGGRFFKKSDLLKLYGMDSGVFVRLRPYVAISEQSGKQMMMKAEPVTESDVPAAFVLTDINRATAEQLQAVKGIGPAFSARIVKYRDILGGYSSKKQLHEVYGLQKETIDQLWKRFDLDADRCCTKTNINLASFDSVSKHPYLSYNQAKAIIAFREQHGLFTGWDDLRQIKILPDSVIQKLKPYFEF